MTCNPSHSVLKFKVLVVARKRYLTCWLQTGADTWNCKRWWGPKGPAMGGQNCTEHEESIALSHGTFLLSLSLCNPSSSSRILLISFPVSCLSCPRKQPRAAHRYSHTRVSPHFTGLTGSALHVWIWTAGSTGRSKGTGVAARFAIEYIYWYFWYSPTDTRLKFSYGVETRHFVGIAKVPNLSHYKMMLLNLLRVTENDNMILLQNEDLFYHQGTWREHSTTTNWRLARVGLLSLLLHVKQATATRRICVSLLAQHVPTTCHLLHITRLIFFTCCCLKGNLLCYKMRLGFNMV